MSAMKALISFYTIIHMDITEKDMQDMEHRFYITPVVGFIFAIILLAEGLILLPLGESFSFGNTFVTALIMLVTVYAGSKFLHFDGLTDFGDGMIVSGTREDHVRALKDTLVGAGGIGVALITVCCSIAFYSMYTPLYAVLLLPIIEIFVKNAMVFAASFGIPGNGMAAKQVSETPKVFAVIGLFVSLLLSFIILFVASLFITGYTGMDLIVPLQIGIIGIFVAAIVSSIVGLVMARTANRVFGMVNGDVLGATNEIARPFVAFFIILLAMVSGVVM